LQVALPTPSDRFLAIPEAVAAIDNNKQNIDIKMTGHCKHEKND